MTHFKAILRELLCLLCGAFYLATTPLLAQQPATPPPAASGPAAHTDLATLDGAKARLTLLSDLSSKLPSGSSFQASLTGALEVRGRRVLVPGTLLEGRLESIPARRPLRAGSLRLLFDRVKLPDGTEEPISALLSAAYSDAVKVNEEGVLRPALSKKRLALQLGGAGLASKLADDLSEATLGSSSGKARYFGMAGAAAFLLFQKGREVKLHHGDVIEIEFTREGKSPRFDAPAH